MEGQVGILCMVCFCQIVPVQEGLANLIYQSNYLYRLPNGSKYFTFLLIETWVHQQKIEITDKTNELCPKEKQKWFCQVIARVFLGCKTCFTILLLQDEWNDLR